MADDLTSKPVRRFKQRIDRGDVIESPSGEFVLAADYDRLTRREAELVKERDEYKSALTLLSEWPSNNLSVRDCAEVANEALDAFARAALKEQST